MDPNTLVLPEVSGRGALFAQKLAETQAAGLQKRADANGLPPAEQLRQEFLKDAQTKSDVELAGTYGSQLLGEFKQHQAAQANLVDTANRDRTTGELGKDANLSLLSGGVNLVAGTGVLAQDAASRDLSRPLLLAGVGLNKLGLLSDEKLGAGAQALTDARTDVLLPQQQLLGQFNDWRNTAASPVKQADQALMTQENAAAEQQHVDAYNQAVANGDNATAAAAARILKDYGHDFGNVFDHPTTLLDTAIEQVPTFAIGGVAKGAVTADQLAAGVSARVAKAAAVAGTDASAGLLKKATVDKVAESLAHANTRALVTGTEIGSNYGQTAGDIANAPLADLIKRFPDVAKQLAAGVPEDQVREQLASDAGMLTAAITAPIAYGSSFLAQDFLAHPAGKGVATTLKKVGTNIAEQAGEVAEESLQGAGGQLAQNIANKDSGDASVTDLLKGVGGAGGQGGAAALGAAGAFRAPSLAAGAATLSGDALATAAKAAARPVAKYLNEAGAKVEEAQNAPVRAQRAAVSAGLAEAADTVSSGLETQVAEASPENVSPAAATATAPVESDPLLTPDDVGLLKQNQADPAAPLNKVKALSRAVQMLNDIPDEDPRLGNLKLFAIKAARDMRANMDSFTDPAMKKAANHLLNNEWVRQLEDDIKAIPEEQINSTLAKIPETALPAEAQLTPEVQQALAQVAEIAANAPEKLSTVQTGRALFHSERLTPEQKSQLELAQSLAQVREGFLANSEKIHKQYPTIKPQTDVSENILNTGFTLGNKTLPSLNDMARNVVQALGNGHKQLAVQALTQMRDFTESRIQRAQAFDEAARAHVEAGSVKGKPVEVANTRQLKTETSLGKEANFVDVTSEGSRGLIDTVHNDAQTAAGIFNTLAAAHPELGLAELSAPKEASYKSMTRGDGVAAPGSIPAGSAPAKAPTSVSSTVTSLEGKVAAAAAYASNPPAGASVAQMREHIATMERIEKAAVKSRDATDMIAEGDKYQRLDDLRMNAKDARESLQLVLDADAKERASGGHPDDLLVDETTDRRQATEQRAAIDSLPAEDAEKAKLKARVAELEQAHRTSSVTGLPNQKAFEEDASLGWSTVGAADMDGLKKLNDSVGHEAADLVLKALGEHLLGLQSDTVRFYHRSGDEFAARFQNADEAAKVMASVQAELDSMPVSFTVDGTPYTYNGIGFSVGHGASYEAADAAVNADKQSRLAAGQRENPRDAGTPRRLQSGSAEGQSGEPDVQREEAPATQSVAERFPGPAATLGELAEDASPVSRYLRTNKFLTAFKFNPKSSGLFARLQGGLETVAEALVKAAADPLALREAYAPQHQYLPVSAEQATAMRQIIGSFVPEIVDTLNQSLYNAAMGLNPDGSKRVQTSTGKAAAGFLEKLLDPALADAAVWQYGDKMSLHAAVWGRDEQGKPFIHYQPEVAQAMALAVLNWGLATVNNPIVVDREELMKMYPDGVPENLMRAYETSHFAVQPIRTMAADLTRILGVSSNPSSSVWYTDGLPKALVSDALNALAQTGAITLTSEQGTEIAGYDKKGKPIYKTLPFITFNKSGDTNNWSKPEVRNLKSLRDALGNPALMTYLLTPDAQDLPTFGEPTKQVPTRQSGTGQLLSEKQRDALTKRNAAPLHANNLLINFQEQLGDDNLLSLLGYSDPASALNEQHARQVNGVNLGLENALDNLRGIFTLWQAKADETNQNMQDIPAFYSHRMVSNGRTMANGFGPQSDKIAREVISAVRDTLDLKNNEEHQIAYSVSLAQALGIKTEKVKNLDAAVQIQTELSQPAFKQLFADMTALADAEGETQQDLANSITRQIKALQRGEGVTRKIESTARAIHALFTHSRLLASPNPEAFETYLAVELDGKTDGPINAIVHFGLHTDDLAKQLDQLRKGGWFLNESDPKVLADLGSKAADLYTDTADRLQQAVNGSLSRKMGIDRQMLAAALHLLQRVGHVALNDAGEVTVTRSMPKGGLVSMNYGAGEKSVNTAIAYDILDYVHQEMSRSLADNQPLDPKLQAAIRLMTGRYLDKKGVWQESVPAQVSDLSIYAKGLTDRDQIKRLVRNLQQTAGGMLTDIIQSEMAPVMSTYQLLYKASALQTAQLRKAYNEAYDAKQKARVAAGELGPTEALSREDEQAILADLAHLVPAYATLTTGGAAEQQGTNVSTKDNKGGYAPDGSAQQVRSIFGGTKADINTTQITNPGVRAAPLLTIAGGDATMMTLLDGANPAGTLNVYDGWEVGPSQLKQRALEANQAVYEGWQYDLLGSVAKALDNASFDFIDTLDDAEIVDLAKAMRLEGADELSADALVGSLHDVANNTRRQLAERAADTQINKGILRTLASSNDHMSTGEKPFQNEGVQVEDLPAYIAEQQAKARGELTDEVVVAAEPAVPKNVSEVLANLTQEGIRTLDATDVQLLIEHQGLQGKVRQFAYAQIKHLFPANLQVHIGNATQISAKQRSLFPGVDFGGKNEVGATYENHVFIKNASEETLVHELVHAAITGLLDRFYNRGMKGLTAHQRDAVRQLETMARAFVDTPHADNESLQQAKAVVYWLLDEGDTSAAVNEFVAWTLSNHQIQDALAKVSALDTVKALAKKVMDVVRRALGLPKNMPVESFLAQAMGQVHRLARRPALAPLDVSGTALFQSLAGSNSDRLQDLAERLEWLRTNLPKDGLPAHETALKAADALVQADEIRERFVDAGFAFDPQQQYVFEQMQALMASTIQLDSAVLEQMQQLYSEVMPHLSSADFLTDPNDTSSPAISEAETRFNALQGVGNLSKDPADRSNLLANFLALALVDDGLRAKLATLVPAKVTVDKSSVDSRIRSLASAAFDKLTDFTADTAKAPNQQVILDRLVNRLSQNQKDTIKRQNTADSILERAENQVKARMAAVGSRANTKLTARLSAGQVGGINGWINGALNSVRGLTSVDGSEAFAESLLSFTNEKKLPAVVSKLIGELVGRTKSNERVIELLDKSKSMVSRVRQRLREEAPAQVRALFTTPISKADWATLHKVVGKADMAALLDNYNRGQIQSMLRDPAALQAGIAALEGRFTDHAAEYAQAAKDLGHYMVTGNNRSAGLLYSNAHAMSRLLSSGNYVSDELAATMAPLLDRLTSLRAMEALSQEERNVAADLLANQPEGMEGLLRLMKTLGKAERSKTNADKQLFNAQKGYVPESLDPRSKLVLASASKAAELVKMGYRMVAPYDGDLSDVNAQGMAYYAIKHIGGQASYSQGAMQTVEGTVAGVDQFTGQSQGVALQTMITHPQTVADITTDKMHSRWAVGSTGTSGSDRNLVPIFNDAGEVIAYQRTLDPAMIDSHLRGSKDLPQAIGSWLGRQAEEAISREVNKQLVSVLHDKWEEEKATRGGEYVDIAAAKSGVLRDTWNSIPRETQQLLRDTFGRSVMVRKDMLDNALGYRAASIADVFTGLSDLSPETRKTIANVAYALLGKKAYQRLVYAERAIQGVVGVAKETVVVRSLTVALNNGLSNQFQLLAHGVPIHRLLQMQLSKVREVETYLRQEKRLTQIKLELASATRPDVRSRLNREQQVLQDANSRLSIWPLILNGELPSIAEGLSEHDEYTVLNDFSEWLGEKTKDFPPGIITAAKYALITKDTALHQGLSRAVQFGDFMSKATLYEHMLSKGKTQEEALRYVNDRFVNYNLMAGRTRDYLESMGITWFWNYKIRIQKVILATLRDNPLRFLSSGLGAEAVGSNSLLGDNALNVNWEYSIGPGQLAHARNMLMWNQLVN